MTQSLSNDTFIGHHLHIELGEPENPKAIDLISWIRTDEAVEILYYREGSLKESCYTATLTELIEWADKHKYIFLVWALPYYDQSNDEEYIVLCPPTSEMGTAEEINERNIKRFLADLTDGIVEHFLRTRKP